MDTLTETQSEAVDVLRGDFDRMRGRLFELVEATGMPDRQEEAFKRLIRRLTYDSQGAIEAILRGKEPHAR